MVVVPRQAYISIYSPRPPKKRMRAFCCTRSSTTLVRERNLLFMERIHTVEVGAHVGERVRVAGWLHSLRRLGGISFLVIRDGWGIVQVVAETEAELGPLQDGSIGVESIVAVEG